MKVLMRICPQCGLRTEGRVCETDGFQTVDEGLLSTSGDPRVGCVFEDRYRIEGVLGRGGMGTVYRATQLSVGRPVALKVLNADRVTDLTTIARFQQEARAIAALRHPNTIRLIDFGQAEDGTLYLVMEFLEGEPLSSLLKRESPLAAERVIRVGLQVLESLAEAHNVGIVHRDLKPDNLFVTELFGRPDFVKILDFGIAKVSGFGQDPNLTGVGVALGSPRYMAPEQASAAKVDARTDLYALGVVLYEMLAGRPPFLCGSVAEYMLAHVQLDVPEMTLNDRPLTGRLPDFIYACLSKYPLHRPTGAAQAIERLRACAGAPFEPAPVTASTRGSLTVTDTALTPPSRPRADSAVLSAIPAATAFDQGAASASIGSESSRPGDQQEVRTEDENGLGGLRPSETGLSPRSPAVQPLPAHQARATPVWPIMLAAVSLLGLGATAAWWGLSPGPSDTATTAGQEPTAEVTVETVAIVETETSSRAAEELPAPATEEASESGQEVVMLITVPPGATVTRGKAVLGQTPLALVWGKDGGRRGLQIRLDGYQRERLRRSDVGASGRYELYLRPVGASTLKGKRRRQPADGEWIDRISKPKTSERKLKAAPAEAPKPPLAPPPKATVYEELD
jgi:serine/threonine protein kinase